MRIVLLGPPGAGKGTQSQRLAERLGARHIATGDLVRAEIAAGTELGRQVRGYYERGELVPNSLIVGLVRPCLTPDGGWILDGFPRDEQQARTLDAALREAGVALDRVIALEVPDDELVRRLSGRRQSASTGKVYHLAYNPPPPDDPGPLVRRADDDPEDIKRRLEVYHAETEPLKAYYAAQGLLTPIDASGPIDAVSAEIEKALDAA